MCPICEGGLMLLGILGQRAHYQCRCCGAQVSEGAETGDDDGAEL